MADFDRDDKQAGAETYNAFDPATPARVEQQAADDRRRADSEERLTWIWWHEVLSTPRGRKEIWLWIKDAGTFRMGNENYQMAPAGVPADRATDYHLGSRDYGLSRWEWLLMYHTEHAVIMRLENDPRYAEVRRKLEEASRNN